MKTLLISLIGLVIAAIANAQQLQQMYADPAICDATQCVCTESEAQPDPNLMGPCRNWMNQAYGSYGSVGGTCNVTTVCSGYDAKKIQPADNQITMPDCANIQPCPSEPPFELPPPATDAPGTSSPTVASSNATKTTGVVLILGWALSVLIMN